MRCQKKPRRSRISLVFFFSFCVSFSFSFCVFLGLGGGGYKAKEACDRGRGGLGKADGPLAGMPSTSSLALARAVVAS